MSDFSDDESTSSEEKSIVSSEYCPSDDDSTTDDEDMGALKRGHRKDVCATGIDAKSKVWYINENIEIVGGANGRLYTAKIGKNRNSSEALMTGEWARLMAENSARGSQARRATIKEIKTAPFLAAFFETKGVNLDTVEREPFSFVLVDSPELHHFGEMGADAGTFASHFTEGEYVVTFDNLGKDALLIAPTPPVDSRVGNLHSFSHLLKFVREAKDGLVHGLFKKVASELLARLQSMSEFPDEREPEPIWISTSGLGVAWIHFRLDSSPKYYEYQPFGEPPRRRNPTRNARPPLSL